MTPVFSDDENWMSADMYADGHLRALQRDVQVWRARTVLTFADEAWLDEVMTTAQSLPPPPQVSVDLGEDAEQST